jgi:hypothetical protein
MGEHGGKLKTPWNSVVALFINRTSAHLTLFPFWYTVSIHRYIFLITQTKE